MFRIPEEKKYVLLFFVMTCLLSLSACSGIFYGSININSNPPGATVYLDGVDTGMITPIVLTNITAGTHNVRVDLFHYKTREDDNVSVNAGDTTYINWALTYASTETFALQPGSEGRDTLLSEGAPDGNFGNSTLLYVGYSDLYYLQTLSYLYFDVSSFPLDSVVTSAYLKLYQWAFFGTGTLSIALYPVTGDWEENLITWDNQPTSSLEAEDTNYVSNSTENTWRSWSIGDLVKGWLDGSITNYGMIVKPESESEDHWADARFYSSDYSNTDYCPQLVISYYIP